VASNVRALGGQVRLIGIIGRDPGGKRLMSELKSRGISAENVLVDPGRPTTSKTRVIAHHQQVVRIDREKIHPIAKPALRRLLSMVRVALPKADGVIIEDYGKGLLSPKLLKDVIGSATRFKKVIAVDPKEEHFSSYRGVTALTPNKREAALAAGMPILDYRSLLKAGRKIARVLRPEALLITLGEEGMCLFETDGRPPVKIPTVAREVFDVSGAGDAVIAAFTLARAAGSSFLEAAVLANAAAGVVVGKVGIAACTPQELIRQMFGGAKQTAPPIRRTASWTP